jgi:hypothetical protein
MATELWTNYQNSFADKKNLAYFLNPEDFINQCQKTSSANRVVAVKSDMLPLVIIDFSNWASGQQISSRNRYVEELLPRPREQTGELGKGIDIDVEQFRLFPTIFKAEEPNERESLSPESSLTTSTTQSQIIMHKIKALFAAAKYEVFEEGMESHFSKCLTSMIDQYGSKAIEASSDLSVQSRTNSEVVYEIMRLFGRIRGLRHPVPRVRDGAALGLASLDDPQAIHALREAIAREQCQELREDIKQVLKQLEYNC